MGRAGSCKPAQHQVQGLLSSLKQGCCTAKSWRPYIGEGRIGTCITLNSKPNTSRRKCALLSQRCILPVFWQIDAGMRAQRAKNGEFSIRHSRCTHRVMSTASAFEHLQVSPLHKNPQERTVAHIRSGNESTRGQCFKSTIKIVCVCLRRKG